MSEVFRRAGYKTFATGKWHYGQHSFLKCFDEAEGVFFGGTARDAPGTARPTWSGRAGRSDRPGPPLVAFVFKWAYQRKPLA
jgi:arylsulfatase A-like enzyme